MKYCFNKYYDKAVINDYMVISDQSFKTVYLLKDLEQHILDCLIQFDSEKVNSILKKEFKDEYNENEYRDFIKQLLDYNIIISLDEENDTDMGK